GWPQRNSSAAYLATRDWVDKSVGWNTKVAALLGEAYDPVTSSEVWWEAQFWNRSVDQEYLPPGNDPMNQDRFRSVSVNPRTGALEGLQGEGYTLSSSSSQRFRIAGARLVRNVGLLTLERIPARPRAVWSLDGTDSVGRLAAGSSATYRRFRPGAPSVLYVRWTQQGGAARRPAVEVRARGWGRT